MKKTPLYEQHIQQKATIVEFAGYKMPIKYQEGMIEEHLWVRKKCGIFDVSHMGQAIFTGKDLVEIFSRLTPSNFSTIKNTICKYTVLTNENGGIIDDLIITKLSDSRFFVVWNASRKEENTAHIRKHFPNAVFTTLQNALIAVQGPQTMEIMHKLFPISQNIEYMRGLEFHHEKYGTMFITRTGYTGEVGFEISVSEEFASEVWQNLLERRDVKPIGLGARDTLRLEVGYPLYGNDINMHTNPIQASLSWVVSKNHTGYVGYQSVILHKLSIKRMGIILEDKGIMRSGYEIFDENEQIGVLTSGGYSPTLEKSIGQAYLPTKYKTGDTIQVKIRNKALKASVSSISFIKTNPK